MSNEGNENFKGVVGVGWCIGAQKKKENQIATDKVYARKDIYRLLGK